VQWNLRATDDSTGKYCTTLVIRCGQRQDDVHSGVAVDPLIILHGRSISRISELPQPKTSASLASQAFPI